MAGAAGRQIAEHVVTGTDGDVRCLLNMLTPWPTALRFLAGGPSGVAGRCAPNGHFRAPGYGTKSLPAMRAVLGEAMR